MAPSFTEIERMAAERRHRVLEAVRDQIEPAARACMFEEVGPISMAISLKRIADFVCGRDGPDGGRMDIVAYLGREFGGSGK